MQSEAAVFPVVVEYFPAIQSVHCVLAGLFAYLPAAQSTHVVLSTAARVAEAVPAGQSCATLSPGQNVPGVQ